MDERQYITGLQYAQMVHTGTANLRSQVQTINDLNVFPIPDGDTGDNMLLTMLGGVQATEENSINLSDISRQIANGMLLAARGNSGVILSQFIDGIADGFTGLTTADISQIGEAFRKGVQYAYDAVMEPAEGTILTVAHDATEFACNQSSGTPEDFLLNFIEEAKRSLKRTPELLPVLKKAGVVDSGAAGLICIAEGMLQALRGETPDLEIVVDRQTGTEIDVNLFTEDDVLEYGYCTELLLRLQKIKTAPETFDVSLITDYLQTIGDSVVTFKSGSIVKIHVHTMTPDKVLAFCQQYGEFLKIKIENMSLQHNQTIAEVGQKPEAIQRKAYGVVAVVSGEGLKQAFRDLGADEIVEGGQCMNPSTEDFLAAFQKVNADTILVLPNNGNVILAAKQAAQLYEDSDVRVLESRTIGAGYTALSMLDTDSGDTNQIVAELQEAMKGVITAGISQSVRDAEMKDISIKCGDYIGLVEKEILLSAPERLAASYALIDKLDLTEHEICILVYGKDADEHEALEIQRYIEQRYPKTEVYLINGKQDVYSYIMIAE